MTDLSERQIPEGGKCKVCGKMAFDIMVASLPPGWKEGEPTDTNPDTWFHKECYKQYSQGKLWSKEDEDKWIEAANGR